MADAGYFVRPPSLLRFPEKTRENAIYSHRIKNGIVEKTSEENTLRQNFLTMLCFSQLRRQRKNVSELFTIVCTSRDSFWACFFALSSGRADILSFHTSTAASFLLACAAISKQPGFRPLKCCLFKTKKFWVWELCCRNIPVCAKNINLRN